MAKCIGNNTVQIVPYECPPLKNITCANGKTPVLVYDEYHCCQHYECDCECEGWGDPHYITFDGLYYSYQGQCSYYLMREIIPKHGLEIYIDNVHCDPTEDVSCPRSLTVNYGGQNIKLINFNLNGRPDLKAFRNEVSLRLPYWEQGVKVMSTGINIVLEIIRLRVVVKFGRTGFSVNLPYQYFGQNTQGHCGTCSNNQTDDCRLPGGKEVDCAVMADYWLLENDKEKPECIRTPAKVETIQQTPCDSNSICDLLKSSLFAECHQRIRPDNFYTGCIFDSCNVHNRSVECTSLEIYAAACAEIGICIHWRNHTELCASDCPSDKIYRPCGPADQPSCNDNPNDPILNFTTEGCFCPEGMKLFSRESQICVKSCGCLDPDGTPREFNETFEYKCQNCVCDESTKTVICKPKPCPTPAEQQCSGPGYVLVNQTDPSDPCCTLHVCQCESRACPEINMNCQVGFRSNIRVPEGKCCPENRCERKQVCVQNQTEYRPGSSVPGKKCENCICSAANISSGDLVKIECRPQKCDETCGEGFEYVKTNPDECCGTCVQTHCVISVNGTTMQLKVDETWSPPENKCESKTCVKSGESFTVIRSKIVCPFFQESNCKKDTIQTAANGCCKICVEKEKACRLEAVKTSINHNGCQAEVDMPYCEGSCNTFSKYSEAAGAMEHSCSCCKERRLNNRTIDLACENGGHVQFTYEHIEECGCGHTECTTPAGHLRRKRRFTLQ
ncbi:PREDICTED: intestinal mucin-like protein [Cyprinodon variegatus]|uniref:Intestinal mucin-like protein n=1 Tax=Cyprinodon variegatus TaxID=28743 RepID=A0A3Q2FUZ6_CYPVA|nr:PREDICTED: intestinal mucin-like protein [Cyprinodon variegatus]